MDGCTINIAEFRCRAIDRTKLSFKRPLQPHHGFAIVANEGPKNRHTGLLQEAVLEDDPTVYDIGLVREVQRLRHRAVLRPVGLQRKAKVLRFRNEAPIQLKRQPEELRGVHARSGMPDGPSDLPPAA